MRVKHGNLHLFLFQPVGKLNITIIQKMQVKYLHAYPVFDFRKMKSQTKIPITIKSIATTAIIIPIISSLPISFLKIMKYNIHSPAFINVWHLRISLFKNNIFLSKLLKITFTQGLRFQKIFLKSSISVVQSCFINTK